jgi:hypothetical protein
MDSQGWSAEATEDELSSENGRKKWAECKFSLQIKKVIQNIF